MSETTYKISCTNEFIIKKIDKNINFEILTE
jgi:hypothetical protein